MLLRLALAILAFMTTLPPASADTPLGPLVLTGPAEIEAVNPHLEHIIDPDWQLKAEDFSAPSALELRPLPGATPDFGYTNAKIWLRLPVVNATDRVSDWRFLVHVGFTQGIAVYRIGADGEVTTLLDLNEDSAFGARPVSYPYIVAPFDLAPGEAAAIVVAYNTMGAARHAMSVETPDSLGEIARIASAKNYAFYGMMLVMVALALVALATLRQPVFAAYAAYLASILLYVAYADGVAFQYLWPSLPRFNGMAAVATGSCVMVFGTLFAISFLQTARFHPFMHRLLIAVVLTVLLLDAVLLVLSPAWLNRLMVYMILVCVLIFVAAGIVAARTRFREVRFYLLSWTASLIPAFMFTARFAFGYEPSFITTNDAIRLALVLDALMMGLAIFDRHNHLRQMAVEETLAQARRNLALSQRLSALEERYAQATTNARQREESVKDTVHDLRQPMHALRLSLRQMLNAGGGKAADAAQVDSALGYMEKLVAERLAEANEAEPRSADDTAASDKSANEPGLYEVLRGVADMFASEAADKGLELRLVLATTDGKVAAYPLMRVVSNLVSNAIKYTREGRVVVALRPSGSGHRVEVHDTGPGLTGADFEQALLRNQRLDRDRAAAEGSGLGLAVAKEIAGANGWVISSCADRRTGASIRLELSGAV
jgi:two-component system, sensor histidine kinase LadS